MAFSTNYSNLSNLMAPGEYEFVISDAYEDVSQGNSSFIMILLVVRNDVVQEYHNKALRIRMYMTENAAPYSEQRMNTISKCVGLPEGAEYETYDAWCDAVRGLPVRAYVRHREYQGDTYEDIRNYRTSQAPECAHVWKDDRGDGMRRFADRGAGPVAHPAERIPPTPQVDEDELPF